MKRIVLLIAVAVGLTNPAFSQADQDWPGKEYGRHDVRVQISDGIPISFVNGMFWGIAGVFQSFGNYTASSEVLVSDILVSAINTTSTTGLQWEEL